MKVLFSAIHFGYFRNFESVIVALATRGHQVHLVADEPEDLGGQQLVERLAATYPGVTWGFGPSLDDESWFRVARKLRAASDYVRFHDPEFDSFKKTRRTLGTRIPTGVLRLMQAGVARSRIARSVLRYLLRAAEALMPVSEASKRFIESQNPDIVLLASVTAWRVPQIDHLRAARALGRRTAVCVFSWDHLSSKALLRNVPDRMLLWNETQKREAMQWHGVPEERIVVTGAQCYDQWFGRQPSRDRDTFCRALGLDPEQPLLLFVCSVMTPDPRESRLVLQWVEQIRKSSDPRLRNASILVRPHPERMDEWEGVTLEGFGNATLYGRNPVSPATQADYFDSLFHSHLVVGLVTSAFLEAAIVGRPVHTLTLPEFELYQEGVQHFRYLTQVEGGLLKVSRTMDAHLAALASELATPVGRDEQNARFVRAFIRPQGLDSAATPAFVEAVEQAVAQAPLPADVPGALHAAMQPIVLRLTESAEHGWLRPAVRDSVEAEADVMEAGKAARKQQIAAERAQRTADKQALLALRRRERQREHLSRARKKLVKRANGMVRRVARAASSGSAWRHQAARVKGRLKALIGLA